MTQDQFAFDILDCLRSPLILHSPEWGDTIDARYRKLVPIQRMAMALQNREEASDVEVLFYLSTASHVAPLDSEWCDIMIGLFKRIDPDKFNEALAGLHPKELSQYQEDYLLKPLRRKIYEKRRQYLKRQMKEGKLDGEKKPVIETTVDSEDILDQIKQSISITEKHALWQKLMNTENTASS
jgi:hypothetical protein